MKNTLRQKTFAGIAVLFLSYSALSTHQIKITSGPLIRARLMYRDETYHGPAEGIPIGGAYKPLSYNIPKTIYKIWLRRDPREYPDAPWHEYTYAPTVTTVTMTGHGAPSELVRIEEQYVEARTRNTRRTCLLPDPRKQSEADRLGCPTMPSVKTPVAEPPVPPVVPPAVAVARVPILPITVPPVIPPAISREERERIERERQQRLEQARREHQQREAREAEQRRLEQQREQERREAERIARERDAEQRRLEQVRRQREAEQRRLEQERLARERREQERIARERQEGERQQRIERERREAEQRRLETERLRRLEQEQLAREERERIERERQQRLEQERLARERQERIEREHRQRLEQERRAKEEQARIAREEAERKRLAEEQRRQREEQERRTSEAELKARKEATEALQAQRRAAEQRRQFEAQQRAAQEMQAVAQTRLTQADYQAQKERAEALQAQRRAAEQHRQFEIQQRTAQEMQAVAQTRLTQADYQAQKERAEALQAQQRAAEQRRQFEAQQKTAQEMQAVARAQLTQADYQAQKEGAEALQAQRRAAEQRRQFEAQQRTAQEMQAVARAQVTQAKYQAQKERAEALQARRRAAEQRRQFEAKQRTAQEMQAVTRAQVAQAEYQAQKETAEAVAAQQEADLLKSWAKIEPRATEPIFIGLCDYEWQHNGVNQLIDGLTGANTFKLDIISQARTEILINPRLNTIQTLINSSGGPKIIVATTNQTPIVAELTNEDPVHSIILLDPTVSEGTVDFAPIKFNYKNIFNHIYNFYSEYKDAPSGYRKVEPGMGDDGSPYLKTVNIKCITSMADCLYWPLQFIGTDRLNRPDHFTSRADLLLNTIPRIIAETNAYKLNTDLACYLFYKQKDLPLKCTAPLIPETASPFLVVNRFVTLDEQNRLQYIVAKSTIAGGLDYVWFSQPLPLEIQDQLRREGEINTGKKVFVPYSTVAQSLLKAGYWQEWQKSLGIVEIAEWLQSWIQRPQIQQWNELEKTPILAQNPKKQEVASVRIGNDLCPGELNYLEKRFPRVHTALETFLRHTLPKVPKITVVGSGGGIRAMLTMMGALKGLQQIGLLDCTTYISALSGSTWATALWQSVGADRSLTSDASLNVVINQIKNNLQYDIKTGAPIAEWLTKELQNTALIKYAFMQPRTLVDWWGRMVARILFPDLLSYYEQLTPQQKAIEHDAFPLPIYTAINILPDVREEELVQLEEVEEWVIVPAEINKRLAYTWYEFTPYEIGGDWLGAYVPTWAFGRKFAYGISQDQAPEQTLGCFLGVFGSAIGVDLGKIFGPAERFGLGELRMTKARFFNFVYGMQGSPLKNQEYMDMVDAGLAFNLPYPPISGKRESRKADIIIFVDATDDRKHPGDHLRRVAAWAKLNNRPFPEIPAGDLRDRSIRIFQSDNPDSPLVMYIPLAKDAELVKEKIEQFPMEGLTKENIRKFDYLKSMENECSTGNFKYTPEQAETVIRLMQFNVWANADRIRDTINQWLPTHNLSPWPGVTEVATERQKILARPPMPPVAPIAPRIRSEKEMGIFAAIVKTLKKGKWKEGTQQQLFEQLRRLGVTKQELQKEGVPEEHLEGL